MLSISDIVTLNLMNRMNSLWHGQEDQHILLHNNSGDELDFDEH